MRAQRWRCGFDLLQKRGLNLFCFEKPYMMGYFGDYDVDDIVNLCMTWLPVHAWGHATTKGNLDFVDSITSFAVMRERLYEFVENEKERVT